VAHFQIAHDPVGNPTQITTTRGAKSQPVGYRYGEADRLTSVCYGATSCTGKPTGTIGYTYDPVGNRTAQTLTGSAGNSTTRYSYDAADELTRLSFDGKGNNGRQQTVAYDAQGNLIESGADWFSYNLDRTKASATLAAAPPGTPTTPRGSASPPPPVPRSATSAGTSTRACPGSRWTVRPPAAHRRPSGASWPASRGRRWRCSRAASTRCCPTRGGVAAIVAPDGGAQAEYDYDPFGAARTNGTAGSASGSDNPLRFAGAYQDPTLGDGYSFPARDHAPATGRFDSVDPVRPSWRVPAVSTYAYVADRPTTSSDPSGRSTDRWLDAAEAAALPQLDARYGMFNVYAGDVRPFFRGTFAGQICVPTIGATGRRGRMWLTGRPGGAANGVDVSTGTTSTEDEGATAGAQPANAVRTPTTGAADGSIPAP